MVGDTPVMAGAILVMHIIQDGVTLDGAIQAMVGATLDTDGDIPIMVTIDQIIDMSTVLLHTEAEARLMVEVEKPAPPIKIQEESHKVIVPSVANPEKQRIAAF